jgi:hypothetical protein
MNLLNSVSCLPRNFKTHVLTTSPQYGIPTPKSVVAKSPQEALDVAKNFGNSLS